MIQPQMLLYTYLDSLDTQDETFSESGLYFRELKREICETLEF